jgi:hypothetical protein
MFKDRFAEPMPTPALSVRFHRSVNQVEELRSWWQSHGNHPNSDLDHYLMVCAQSSYVLSPAVISVWRDGKCLAVLAGRLEKTRLRGRLGYWNLPGLPARVLTFIHQGLIGSLNSETADLVIVEINRLLRHERVDLAAFSFFPEDSLLFTALAAYPHRGLGLQHPAWSPHWELALQAEPGFILREMRAKHRGWIRRKQRDCEEVYTGRLSWKWHCIIDDVAPLCEAMEKVARHTYQRGLNAGFRDDDHHRQRLGLFAQQGALRVLLLELDGQPAAFWMGLVYRQDFHSSATAYVPELREHEIGTQMFLRLVDELVVEKVRRFDFGLGDAHYKQRFGDRCWRELRVQFFASTAKGFALRHYLVVVAGLERVARRTLQSLGSMDRFKQRWRRAVAKKLPPDKSFTPQ